MLTINLADPSGSSAAEKPPAKKIMLAFWILSTIVSTDLTIASSFSVTNGTKLTFAPFFSKALASHIPSWYLGILGCKTTGVSTVSLALIEHLMLQQVLLPTQLPVQIPLGKPLPIYLGRHCQVCVHQALHR